MDRAKEVSNRLEHAPWRTTQREQRGDYEQRATPSKWGAILSAIINYQNRHGGQSPSDLVLAKDTNLSAGQVQYHVREMEKAKLLTDHKGWPRVLQVHHVAKVGDTTIVPAVPGEKVEEAKVMDSKKVERLNGRRPFLERARVIARGIVDYTANHDEPPGIRELAKQINWKTNSGSTSGLIQIVQKMVEANWVSHQHGHERDIMLTGNGRAALLSETMASDMPVRAPRQTFGGLPYAVEVRPAQAQVPPPAPEPTSDFGRMITAAEELAGLSDVDLVIELTKRGFKVSR